MHFNVKTYNIVQCKGLYSIVLVFFSLLLRTKTYFRPQQSNILGTLAWRTLIFKVKGKALTKTLSLAP